MFTARQWQKFDYTEEMTPWFCALLEIHSHDMLVSELAGVLGVGVCTLVSLQTYNTIIQTIHVINILFFI